MIDYLFSFFAKEIHIKITKDKFYYDDGKNKMEVKTKVFLLEPDNENMTKIVAVGSYKGNDKNIRCIDLFDDKESQKFELLTRYFRFAFEELSNHKSFIRPKIKIEGIKAFTPVLKGYEDYLMHQALLYAGAMNVQFIDA